MAFVGAACVLFVVLLGVFAHQLTGGALVDLRGAAVVAINVAAVCTGVFCLGLCCVGVAITWRRPARDRRPRSAVSLWDTTTRRADYDQRSAPHPKTAGSAHTGGCAGPTIGLARLPAGGVGATERNGRGDREWSEHPGRRARRTSSAQRAPNGDRRPRLPRVEVVGGVVTEHDEVPALPPGPVGDSPMLRHGFRATDQGLPDGPGPAATEAAERVLHATESLEAVTHLGSWRVPGQDAARARSIARAQSRWESEIVGCDKQEARRAADRDARRAARAAEPHTGAPWHTPVKDLQLSDVQVHTLAVIARLGLTAPPLLAQLLQDPVGKSTVHERLQQLHEAGLVARATIGVQGRSGRPPVVYAIAPRGSELLRARLREVASNMNPPRYLGAGRRLPAPGRGENIPRELATQLALVALRQYETDLTWRTARMPGGHWDLRMARGGTPACGLSLADLVPVPGCSVFGAQFDAPTSVEPDLTVRMLGPVGDDDHAAIDLLVEVDPTGRSAANEQKFAAYDQFLGGWCMRTRRFEDTGRPLVVFVARHSRGVDALLAAADRSMSLGFGAPGCYDRSSFDYPGRAQTAFTCVAWLLAGEGFALRLDRLPPEVRGSDTEMPWPERIALFPEAWCPTPRP
jgi:predicted transcriptional regulator